MTIVLQPLLGISLYSISYTFSGSAVDYILTESYSHHFSDLDLGHTITVRVAGVSTAGTGVYSQAIVIFSPSVNSNG